MAWTEDTAGVDNFLEDRLIVFLLQENGAYLLDESEDKIRLEETHIATWEATTAHTATWV